jgi:glycosyltransferase involved in cell wall biosynthesis
MPHQDVVDRVKAADLFLFPSCPMKDGAEEALGLSMLEAAACSVPVVACDVGGIGEVVRDGINGRLVPNSNVEEFACAMFGLLSDSSLRCRFGQQGRQMVLTDFDISRQSLLLEEIYDAAIG